MKGKKNAALLEGTYKLPPEQDLEEPSRPKLTRYSISVTGAVYDRLRALVIDESLATFVDDVVASALDDPATAARIAARCRQEDRP